MYNRPKNRKNLDRTMAKKQKSTDRKRHEFAALPEFDRAMRKLVNVPKEVVSKKPTNHTKRTKNPNV
jgi:hypothetical protein